MEETNPPKRILLLRLLDLVEHFPLGAAPFWILVAALLTGAGVFLTHRRAELTPPDLTFTFFTRNHIDAYMPAIAQFEKEHHCRIQTELINLTALQSRLRAAILSDSKVPDVVELLDGSMGYFASGPLEDVGFVDLTQRIKDEGLDKILVTSRLSNWSSRGHLFAMPHDVHPVALAYRRDLVQQLGIDPDRDLDTWDKFLAVGRRVTKDLDGDGVIDRYMIDLPEGSFGFIILFLQRGGQVFDAEGRLAFDNDLTVDVMEWHVKTMVGPGRIAYPCGWGQNLTRAQTDGLALFYLTPDWRSKVFEMDNPQLKGKMALMPLPAWTRGGSRASTWGGTGICITKQCKNQELAWEFVKYLYYTPQYLGKRFLDSNIIPPLKTAWNLAEFKQANPYYSNQPLGTLYALMAPQVPPVYSNPFSNTANTKLANSFTACAQYYKDHGDDGFRDFIRKQVHETAVYVQKKIDRNAFWRGVSRAAAP